MKILEWVKVKQLTPQSELDYPGTSPDNSEGYVLIYSDWNENGSLDISSDYLEIQSLLPGSSWDYRTLDDGPLI